jgi:hypothetical protein
MGFNQNQARDPNGKWSSGIVDSIEHQVRGRGVPPVKAHALAIEIATNNGFLDARGNPTKFGREREALGHKGRMIDRAARQLGRKPSEIGIVNNRTYVK